MRFFAFLAVALPTLAAATPTSIVPRWNHGDSDTMILNFELAISQLENAFYDEGLRRFDQNAFRRAGFPNFARGRFREIQQHEREHTDFLREAVRESGADTINRCRYRFPLENPRTFARASLDISTIVAAAFTGALGHLENREYSVANGMILSVEARQAGWVNSALFKKNPWNTAFDTSLTFRQAWTALSRFIETCPPEYEELVPPQSTNAFPRLEVVCRLIPGQRGQVRFRGVEDCERRGLYVVFKTGMQEVRARLQKDGSFIVPREVANTGANFIFVTSNDKPVCDENIVAGPTLYQFDFSSYDN
ncbi:hypothetical protein D9756_009516 [Leucocoprinus leucothites]|uniref:Uncharacterized protein n=1 Tax=Leucocoprinus leucothites TaxID=201217 RepID=A0A8H5FTZ5_9AGAR|nr:hypothetical protein D9756_009516 [Leucoagaricus leucothites]